MKPLKEALINKNNRNWASKGEEWYLAFPFSGDQLKLEALPEAETIRIAGWTYVLLKPNQIESDLNTFLNSLSKYTIVWSTTNSINQIKKDFKDCGDLMVKEIVKEIANKKGYELIKEREQ